VLRPSPVERNPLARPFLKRRVESRDRLFEPRRIALPLADPPKCETNVVVRTRPVVRNPLTRPFLQRCAISLDRLLKLLRPALSPAMAQKRTPETILRLRPSERNALTRPVLKRRAKGLDRLLEPRRPLSRSPSVASAVPRSFCAARRFGSDSGHLVANPIGHQVRFSPLAVPESQSGNILNRRNHL
jgi:hypothetical protein